MRPPFCMHIQRALITYTLILLGEYTMSPNPLFTRIQLPLSENFYEEFTEYLNHGQMKYRIIPLLNRSDIKN